TIHNTILQPIQYKPTLYPYTTLFRYNHIIIKNVLKKPKEYTILNLLLMDLLDENRLTKSARDTYQLFKQGYDLNDISIKRQLKLDRKSTRLNSSNFRT